MRTALIAFCLSIIFFSCTKQAEEKPIDKGSLAGDWELRHLTGTFTVPSLVGDYEPGNGNVVKITDNSVAWYTADTLVHEEALVLVSDTCWDTPGGPTVLPRLAERILFFERRDSELIIYTHMLALDGSIGRYARLR